MRTFILLAAASLLCASVAGGAPSPTARDEALLEHNFDALIHPNDLRDWMKLLASQPNHVGSPHDKANAERILAWFKSWGWDAHIETFSVLYPTPISETLELVGAQAVQGHLAGAANPRRFERDGHRPGASRLCRLSGRRRRHAPASSTSITGCRTTTRRLERLGVSVKGKIVIARYGGGWRGLKPKLAQDHGAVGCIIYSDPADDGYAVDETYPDGPMRPPHGIQRGSVADMSCIPAIR